MALGVLSPGVAMALRCAVRRALDLSSLSASALALAMLAAPISTSMAALLAFCLARASSRELWLSLIVKNIGPSSASHSGSTAVTHCMYSCAHTLPILRTRAAALNLPASGEASCDTVAWLVPSQPSAREVAKQYIQ